MNWCIFCMIDVRCPKIYMDLQPKYLQLFFPKPVPSRPFHTGSWNALGDNALWRCSSSSRDCERRTKSMIWPISGTLQETWKFWNIYIYICISVKIRNKLLAKKKFQRNNFWETNTLIFTFCLPRNAVFGVLFPLLPGELSLSPWIPLVNLHS